MEKRLSGVNDVEEPFWSRGSLRGYDNQALNFSDMEWGRGYAERVPDLAYLTVTVSAGLIPSDCTYRRPYTL